MRKRRPPFFWLLPLVALLPLLLAPKQGRPALAAGPLDLPGETEQLDLSPIWGPSIQRWSHEIAVLSRVYGLDPDFIAAVMREESDGQADVISHMGAVGLMGVMPAGPGLEWRPSTEQLTNASINLRWGVSILSEIIRQSGGDLYSALAAYNGGWDQVSSGVPRKYAASVLDHYGRAVAARNGVSPDIASQWTMAIELRRGHVSGESLLILGDQPVSGLQTYGKHLVYHYVDLGGQAYYFEGYAVPVALVVPLHTNVPMYGAADEVDVEVMARLEGRRLKMAGDNPGVLLACLPSLSRLRGHASTRWFAPSQCPSWHR